VVRVVASSVRGPAHVREGLPCQDAWLAIPEDRACLAVVCDGMGSRPRSREGARAATRASRDAWRLWRRSSVGTAEDLIRLLEVCWRLRLGELPPMDCATTCLLYAEDGHGRAALAQLGDGLIARRGLNNNVTTHPSRPGDFGRTHALGCPHALPDWSLALAAPLEPGEALLMATDGVSEDLERRRLGGLMSWVIDEIAPQPHPGRKLATELRRWPVPHHQDDKTLLLLWKPCNPSSK
jgi:serine/threonine protein phosphatase PrpC